MAFPKFVTIREEAPREGFQSEKEFIPTERKIELIDALSETGVRHIQVTSFVSPKWVPQVADAEAVVAGFRAKPGVQYFASYLNEQGLERALATGRLQLTGILTLYCSETYARKNVNRSNDEIYATFPRLIGRYKELGLPILGTVIAAFGCNFEGDVPLQRVVETVATFVRAAEEHGFRYGRITLADSFGWANPEQIRRTVAAVRERWPDLPLALHLHDTRGTGMANVYAGLMEGIDFFDTAVAGMGGSPFARGAAGNIPTEDMVFMCHELGIDTGIDLDKVIACARLAEEIVGHPLPGKAMRGGSLTGFRRAAAGR